MDQIKNAFAVKLMEIKAIKLQPNEPFTWASGWKSPIYTDNRKTLSFPALRSFVKLELCHAIQEHFPEAEAVAGVATGAIAQGVLVADQLGLPFSYVRPKPKDHGMGNQIEGEIKKGAKVVVVEDLISTGGSSLKAVQALRDYGCEVVGMVASFTYGFPVAEEAFKQANVQLITLTDYEHVVAQAAMAQKYTVQSIRERYNAVHEVMRQMTPDKDGETMLPKEYIDLDVYQNHFQFDQDTVSISAAPVGEIKLHIIDRDEPKCVKFETVQSPVPFYLWIQVLPVNETSSKMKVTVDADIPFMLKGMVSGPIQEGVEKIAEALAMIPYV